MKVKVSSLKNPRARIEQGDWVTYTPWTAADGKTTPARFKVSGTSLPAYKIALEEMAKEFALKFKTERVPDDIAFQRNAELIVEHLLHGWEGLDEDYSPELAEKLLTDRDYEALTDAVLWCARRIENVTAEFIGDAEKNSAAPSATN